MSVFLLLEQEALNRGKLNGKLRRHGPFRTVSRRIHLPNHRTEQMLLYVGLSKLMATDYYISSYFYILLRKNHNPQCSKNDSNLFPKFLKAVVSSDILFLTI